MTERLFHYDRSAPSFPPLGDAAAGERAIGHSVGGTQGAILAAGDPRLVAIVIAATGSGIVCWAREQGYSDPDCQAPAREDRLAFFVRLLR